MGATVIIRFRTAIRNQSYLKSKLKRKQKMVRNIVGVFDKKIKTEIMEDLDKLISSSEGKKRYGISMEDVTSDNPFSTLEISNKAIRGKIKIDAKGTGTLDSSAAMILAFAKLTGGKSSVFFTTVFDLSIGSGDKKKLRSKEVQEENLLKAFKYLNCNEKAIKSILEKGEVISADQALKYGIISEIDDLPLPTLKKPRKKKEEPPKEETKDEKSDGDTTAKTDDKVIVNDQKQAKEKTEVNSASADSTVKNSSQAETNSDNTDVVNEPKDEKGSDEEVKKKK